jgi:phage gp29-like protein
MVTMSNYKGLVDTLGNPLRKDDLTTPQTDEVKLAHLQNHYAEHPSKGLTPAKLAGILLQAEQGDIIAQCELAEDIEEKDTHLFSELQKRRLCMKSVPWKLVPPRNAIKEEIRDTDMLQELLEDMTFLPDTFFDMSDAILKGFSNSEVTWHQEEKLWLQKSIDFKDPSWFMINRDDRNDIRLRDNTPNGEALNPFGWVKHVHKTKSGYVSRNGLARILAWPYIFKNYSVRDLAEFNEIYGLPLRVGKYPTGASSTEKRTLLQAVMGIGHNAGGIIPQGMQIEFEEAAKGSEKPFAYMMEFMDKAMSKAILGGTLTSQADGKSSTNALGSVHDEVRGEIRDSDLTQIDSTATRDIVLPMYMFNCRSYTKPSRCPRLVHDTTEAEDMKLFSDSLPGLVSTGVQIPVNWVNEKLQIPLPKPGEAVLAVVVEEEKKDLSSAVKDEKPKETKPQAKLKNMAITKLAALKTKADQAQNKDTADLFTHQLTDGFSPILQGFNDDIETLINGATSLEELQEQLNTMDLSIDEASEVLQLALVASELGGMADVEDGQ